MPPKSSEIRAADPAQLPRETLDQNRRHFGDEPHFFWVVFRGDTEPRLVNVDEVWKAHAEGKHPERFELAPLTAPQRSLLRYLARAAESGES